MGIVVITIPGEAKRMFVNSLHKVTGKVKLVIIQKPKANYDSLFSRFMRLYHSVGLSGLPREIWYAILLRIYPRAKGSLEYFRERTTTYTERDADFAAPVLETESVNSDEVYNLLKNISPDLITIWGSTIVKPHILKTAKHVINLHMGLCPYYRGAIANQHAVINNHFNHIGATIHYVAEKVDSGHIIETITPDIAKSPRDLFRELNDRAEERFIDIASRIYAGEELESTPQDVSNSHNLLLKQWTPHVRYNLAQKMLKWDQAGTLGQAIPTPLQKLDYRL